MNRAAGIDRWQAFAAVVVAWTVLVATGGGAAGVASAEEPAKAVRRSGSTPLSAEAERAALAFAAEHHPELTRLYRQLARNAPEEYAKAVAELDRNRDRLEKLRAKHPERFEGALAEWKLSSRIRLALARLALAPDPALEEELRSMVRERAELRLAPLRAEKERLEKRLEKVGRTLADHDRDPAAAIDREMATATKGLEASRARARQLTRRVSPSLEAATSTMVKEKNAGKAGGKPGGKTGEKTGAD
jgi:hypothetical protein